MKREDFLSETRIHDGFRRAQILTDIFAIRKIVDDLFTYVCKDGTDFPTSEAPDTEALMAAANRTGAVVRDAINSEHIVKAYDQGYTESKEDAC